jgi:hypothetical protein
MNKITIGGSSHDDNIYVSVPQKYKQFFITTTSDGMIFRFHTLYLFQKQFNFLLGINKLMRDFFPDFDNGLFEFVSIFPSALVFFFFKKKTSFLFSNA